MVGITVLLLTFKLKCCNYVHIAWSEWFSKFLYLVDHPFCNGGNTYFHGKEKISDWIQLLFLVEGGKLRVQKIAV